ncbi:MAG: hypothetical protein JJU02_08215 [Cryomorphaceae bacterium]|nr:hypothetical protein [Cryomorphaceae bacterium]
MKTFILKIFIVFITPGLIGNISGRSLWPIALLLAIAFAYFIFENREKGEETSRH